MSPVPGVALLLACLAAPVSTLCASGQVFQPGRLIENVDSPTTPGQRYTLYLPTGFDPSRPTPILYLMDPRGRARVPARLFQAAAERFGYILISSHSTTSDGPLEPNLRAMQAMWDDTQAWFAVDPRRVYIAGFSGTARMASLLAHSHPATITGIIGVGAGLDPAVALSGQTTFLYFGAIGDEDYNFHELESLEQSLAALNLPHRVDRFSGPHSWMTPDVAMRAVEWFELRAMKSGSRSVDAALVNAWWTRDDTLASEWVAQGRVLHAARHRAAMARDYAGLRDTAPVAASAAELAASPAGRAEQRRREEETRASNAWVAWALQTISNAYPKHASAPVVPAAILAQQLDLAGVKATAASTQPAALEARRRLNQIGVQLGFYLPQEAISRSDLDRAGYYLSIAMRIDEASPISWYLMAQRSALLHAPHDALASLQRAVAAGFRDLTLLTTDRSFVSLHQDPGYLALVGALRAAGDAQDVSVVDRPPLHIRR